MEINEYSKDGRSLRIGYRLQQLERLQSLLYDNKEKLINAIFEDLKGKHDVDLIEKVNIYDTLTLLKIEYGKLYNEYKKVIVPNRIDLTKWKKQSAIIIGNKYEPLSSMFIPLIYAISAGTPAILKIDQSPKYEPYLKELIKKYLDNEFYLYSTLDLIELLNADFTTKIISNISVPISGTNDRDKGMNVIGLLDVKDSVDLVIPTLAKWKKVGSGLLLCSPDILLVHELLFDTIYQCMLRNTEIKVQEFDIEKPFIGKKSPDIIYIAKSTTETAISFLNDEKINLFTYFGAEDFANYILKFATKITKGAINKICLTFYDDLKRDHFQFTRVINLLKKLNAKSVAIDDTKKKFYELVKPISVNYNENMGFFEQGFFVGVGAFFGTAILSVGYISYFYYCKGKHP